MPYRPFASIVLSALVAAFSCGVLRGEEEPVELSQARAFFQKDIEFATRPIRDRYLSRLDSLKRSLGSRGDARGAAAVQDEVDRVKETGLGVDRFAGVWSIKYTNGTSRTYSINPEGTLNYTEENGTPISPRSSKITVKGSECIVESSPGIIERLSLSGNKLMVEHFNPKATYPNGAPAARATGTRVVTAKP